MIAGGVFSFELPGRVMTGCRLAPVVEIDIGSKHTRAKYSCMKYNCVKCNFIDYTIKTTNPPSGSQ